MVRVLILCEYPSLNGGERSLLELIRRIPEFNATLIVAAPSRGPLADQIGSLGLEHCPFDLRDREGQRHSHAGIRSRLTDIVAQYQPALVHANSVSMSRILGSVACKLQVPCMGHLRDIIRLSRAAISDLNCHTRLLAVSQATRDWYTTAGLEEQKTFVEHNGVDLRRFAPRRPNGYLHQQLHVPAESRIIGTIGQIGMRKGIDMFLQAAEQVARSDESLHFVVVGHRYSGKPEAEAYEDRVQQLARSNVLHGRVHFLGVRDDVHQILNELTLYVHAARQEPLGRVLIEAAASGVAVVATRVGGTEEIFPTDSESALLVTPDSPTALARAISRLLSAPGLRHELGARARERAERVFDAQHAAQRLMRHYLDLEYAWSLRRGRDS